jgi:hypothetical protein
MKRLALAVALIALTALAAPAGAGAAFGLSSYDVSFELEDGTTAAQAGSHPYAIKVTLATKTKEGEGGEPVPDQSIKDLYTFMVPGFAGDLTAVPPCSNNDFLAHPVPTDLTIPGCANASAIGKVLAEVGEEGVIAPLYAPVYLLEAAPGVAAKLGFWVQNEPVTVDLSVTEDPPYRVVAGLRNVSQVLELFGSEFTIWGNPASPIHDEERGPCYEGSSRDGKVDPKCPAGAVEAPFLTLPRACTGPLTSSWEADPWQHPGAFVGGSVLTHDDFGNPQGMTGCDELAFAPFLSARPSSSATESPTGIDVDIDVTDVGLKNSTGRAASDIRDIETTLPAGVTLNPSAAAGLAACSMSQFEDESSAAAPGTGCPDASKVGTVEAETPILGDRVLSGSVYVGAQDDPTSPGAENPFGSFSAIYLVLRQPELGIFVKQAGAVNVDEASGRVVTLFKDLPQFPLSHVHLQLDSGPRAPLVTPEHCGTYTAQSLLTPWSGGAPVTAPTSFTIDSGPGGSPCPPEGPPPFEPGFEAGSINNAAGSYSPFYMRLTRRDGDQDITRFSAVLPSGVVGKIAGVGRCSDAAIAAAKDKTGRQELASPSCPPDSKVGRVVGGAGVGSALTYVPGSLYLAGPFGDDPLSIAAIVPAVAGPFDVGTVVTRVGLNLNPTTARVEVDGTASDPIPHILDGVPLKLRDLRVYTDRPDFTLNPTSCDEKQAQATLFGSGADPFGTADDTSRTLQARFQAASCASLGFKPKLSLRLRGATKRTGHPSLRSTLRPRGGDANIDTAVVTLPHSEFIDQDHINNPCTRVQFADNRCPSKSILGTATAYSPLLDEPLKGKVYFRSNGGERQLPDVVVDLRGLFQIVLVGEVTSAHGGIRTTFRNVPDAPVSRFDLQLFGGKRGLLVNSTDLCKGKRRVSLALTGQNGRKYATHPLLQVGCGGGKKHR